MKEREERNQTIVIRDIPYLERREEKALKLDVWFPKNRKGRLPACLVLHGGGWTTGDKADEREENMASDLCKMGYAVFSANYHMAEYTHGPYQGKRMSHAWPQCIGDCMDAVAYIRRNAEEYFIRPDKIAVIGSSAGGHLALLIATAAEDKKLKHYRKYQEVPCSISCAVSFYGVPDILSWGGELLMPDAFEESEDEWRLASPSEHLDKEPCPILLVHGDADDTVDLEQSVRFYKKLLQKGYKAELIKVPGGKHSFDFSALNAEQLQKLTEFLYRYLGKESTQHEQKDENRRKSQVPEAL